MSIIAAGTTAGTALKSTGNTDGTIQLQVNGTTPSVTLATTGAIGVGSTPGYGTSGQVLVSGGSAAAPSWATPSAGAMVYISTTTASGSATTLDITSGFSSTYDDYVLIGENITVGVVSTQYFPRFFTASTIRTAGYQSININPGTGTVTAARGNSAAYIDGPASMQVSSTKSSFRMDLFNTNSTSSRIQGMIYYVNTDSTNVLYNTMTWAGFGYTGDANTLTGLRFFWDNVSGTFATGTFKLYGIAKS